MRACFHGLIAIIIYFIISNPVYSYVVGGASSSLVPNSDCWAWDSSTCVNKFREALENPDNFGPLGVVKETITTKTLTAVNATTLSDVDMFIAPWISDSDGPAFGAAVMDFFFAGGDLFLLNDSSGWDYLGDLLGIPTTLSTGSVSNGAAPLFDGPFGVANNVTQHYQVGKLDVNDILAKNGHVGGTNVEGQVTSAYWAAGEYAAGTGALFIIADVDMIATTTACGAPICGADYDNMNDNAIYALNTFSFLKDNGGSAPIPEPATIFLLGLGIIGLAYKKGGCRT